MSLETVEDYELSYDSVPVEHVATTAPAASEKPTKKRKGADNINSSNEELGKRAEKQQKKKKQKNQSSKSSKQETASDAVMTGPAPEEALLAAVEDAAPAIKCNMEEWEAFNLPGLCIERNTIVDFILAEVIVSALSTLGFTKPTPIQVWN